MPKRRSVIQIACDEVQGEDSWVKLRVLTYVEQRDMLKEARKRRKKRREERRVDVEEFGDDDNLYDLGLAPEDMDEILSKYVDHIVEWNWVDDDDKPLPQPGTVENPLTLLNTVEIAFLGEKLAEGKGDSKN